MTYLTIEVTEQDIKRGIAGNCWQCPIALATHRAMGWNPSAFRVRVRDGEICLIPENSDWLHTVLPQSGTRHWLPYDVTEWIVRFDQFDEVEPICFEIEIEEE